ncbi:MAG TPA: penicillin-binding transpeptidase domain-containing protein [Skermanella sp.]|nr:penicillin-binding transpeptidase domain-containing protein [Skermanella sp.]
MRRIFFFLHLTVLSVAATLSAPALAETIDQPELDRYFKAAGTRGVVVIQDTGTGKVIASDSVRAAQTFLPASTFKIPMALIALETGVVKDAHKDVLPWNGVDWIVPACNADQTLASALARSCVPIFAELGRKVGDERLNASLKALGYGNQDASGGYPYWLNGNLRISALEQIAFIDKLRLGDLPVSPEHMATVRDITTIESTDGAVIHAKTGWADSPEPDIGWVTGWVERGGNAWLFALNLDVTTKEHVPARLAIAKAALKEVGALP